MANHSSTLGPKEADAFAEFVAYASDKWAESQVELASIAGISQAMIATIISKRKQGGGRSLRAISTATGVSIDEILSGVGIERLKSRNESPGNRRNNEERNAAAEALSKLYRVSFDDALGILNSVGLVLPVGAPATSWFDVGRAAIDRSKNGLPIARHVAQLKAGPR